MEQEVPRILKSLFEFNFGALWEPADSAMCWIEGRERAVWFVTDSILFYQEGKIDLSPDHKSLSLGRLVLFDLHGYKPKLLNERDRYDRKVYEYPTEVNGNGLPIMAWMIEPSMRLEQFYPVWFMTEYIVFGWKDQSVSQEPYRKDGPDKFMTQSAKFDRDRLKWSTPGSQTRTELPDSHILNRVQYMNPFQVPFFDDPEDELEYLVEVPK